MKNSIYKILIVLIAMLSTQQFFAQKETKEIVTYARDFVFRNFNETKTPNTFILIDSESRQQYYVVNFKEGGYVLVTDKEGSLAVTSIVPAGEITLDNKIYIEDSTKAIKQNVSNFDYPKLETSNTNNRNTEATVDNFLPSEWGSVNCIDDLNNIVNVSNFYTPSNCSAGCVAISTAQILHYYNWPIKGVGNNVYAENYNGSLVRHGAFFDSENYDWANMLDKYMYVNSSDLQQESVGKLVYDVAVAVEMNFEPSGSSSNVNKVPFLLENYFRFVGHYQSKSWSSYWSRLYNNVQDGMPVPMAIDKISTSEGHAMVACGYKWMDGKAYYYINWGWYNSGEMHNGWENLAGWNSSKPGYNRILGGILDMMPEPQITGITRTGSGDDFNIHWEVARNIDWEEFTLQKKRNYDTTWQTVATGIVGQDFVYENPTGEVYQFRVKGKANGTYFSDSYSESVAYAVNGSYNGYGKFEGGQFAYANQTANYDLIFNHDYTFETWIRVKNGNQTGDVILDRFQVFSLKLDEVTTSDYSINFYSPASEDSLNSNQSGVKLQKNQWYHIAVSTTGYTSKLFINGVERDSDPYNHFHLNSSNNAINIGEMYRDGNYSNHIKADFDQMRWSDIGRYASDFTPDIEENLGVDDNTKAYFRFQNMHRNRLKDDAFNVSVKVNNATNHVRWRFDYTAYALSVNEQALFNDSITVYPNPTQDIIQISISDNETFNYNNTSFVLYDLNGKQLPVEILKKGDIMQMDISNLATGNYLLTAKGVKFTASKQIIKK